MSLNVARTTSPLLVRISHLLKLASHRTIRLCEAIVVQDGAVEVRDGSGLWGLNGKECIDRIRHELGSDKFHVAYIGPAGENLVRYACVGHDLRAFAGRCGAPEYESIGALGSYCGG